MVKLQHALLEAHWGRKYDASHKLSKCFWVLEEQQAGQLIIRLADLASLKISMDSEKSIYGK